MKRLSGLIIFLILNTVCGQEALTSFKFRIEESKLTRVTVNWEGELPENLKDDKLKMVSSDERFHYHVILPKGYYKGRKKGVKYPYIIVDSPGGNAQRELHRYKDWLQKNKWIGIMLEESRNGSEKCLWNWSGTLLDIKKRFAISKRGGVFTGFSGGGRRSTYYSYKYSDFAGAALHAGGVAARNLNLSELSDFYTATIAGDHCFNLGEVYSLSLKMKENGYYDLFRGGHQWHNKERGERALNWLFLKMSTRKIDPLAKEIVGSYVWQLMKKAKEDPIRILQEKHLKDALFILNKRADVEAMPKFRGALSYLRKQVSKYEKSRFVARERKALDEYNKAYLQYCVLGHSQAVCTVTPGSFSKKQAAAISKAVIPNRDLSIQSLESILEKYKKTYASTLAEKELERLKTVSEVMTRGGY